MKDITEEESLIGEDCEDYEIMMNDEPETNFFPKYFSILHEVHQKGKATWNDKWETCQCSYCVGSNKIHFGLNIPKDWTSWNSWYVIKYWPGRYIRWTNGWMKFFKHN